MTNMTTEIRISGRDVEILEGNTRITYTAVDHPIFSTAHVADTIATGQRGYAGLTTGAVWGILAGARREGAPSGADMRDAVTDLSVCGAY